MIVAKKIHLLIVVTSICVSSLFGRHIEVKYDEDNLVQAYTVARLKAYFAKNPDFPDVKLRLLIADELGPEAYRTIVERPGANLSVTIEGGDAVGLLYGSMDLLEQLRFNQDVEARAEAPRLEFRALKFNLPYVSYREGQALRLHKETVRELEFWEAFLDMMVDNRFNTLTLWSLHPFHLMIRNTEFPEACDLTDEELADWQAFWSELFFMAKQRGIETFIVNWNIFTSPAFAEAHDLMDYLKEPSINYYGDGDSSPIIVDYMRTSITQVIDAYPNLTGLGVSLGERDKHLSPAERQKFVEDTFFAGMREAKREIRFIHRLPFTRGSAPSGAGELNTEQLTRQAIESLDLSTTVLTEAKFNWSHTHSTPKLVKIHGGPMGDTYWTPPPANYKIHWMARNESFFALRWCEPDFIREHIELNGHDYVGGYYLGSECYIPARDYMTQPEFTMGYAFERQWLYYKAWGRLLYNPDLPNSFFKQATESRYGEAGAPLFEALKLGSRMPLRLGSIFDSSWDFTLYAEGFMSVNASSNPQHLITVEELRQHPTLDPDFLSVQQYCRMLKAGESIPEGKITPFQLADDLEADANKALKLVEPLLQAEHSKALYQELVDVQAWAHLSLYFAEKLRAAVAYQRFLEEDIQEQGQLAVQGLEKALKHWTDLSAVTAPVYAAMPLAHVYRHPADPRFDLEYQHPYPASPEGDNRFFNWSLLLPAVTDELQRVKERVEEIR